MPGKEEKDRWKDDVPKTFKWWITTRKKDCVSVGINRARHLQSIGERISPNPFAEHFTKPKTK